MKKKHLLFAPVLLLSLLVTGCGTGFTEIKDEVKKAAALESLDAATQYADNYIDASFTVKVTAAVLTISLKGTIQITGIGTSNPVFVMEVEKTSGDKVYQTYYDGNGTTYNKMYDFAFMGQNIITASTSKSLGTMTLPDIIVPDSNYNFFDKLGLDKATISIVKQKKSGVLTTYIVPVTDQQVSNSLGQMGNMTSELPDDTTLFLGITLNAENKVMGLAVEAKTKYQNTNVSLVFTLTLNRNGAPTIVPPFTPEELAAF